MSYEFVSLHSGVDEVSIFLWCDIVSQALVTNISRPLCRLGNMATTYQVVHHILEELIH